MNSIQSEAIIDTTEMYRYLLTRKWGKGNKMVNFILLNPSTADANKDDPTVRACTTFSKNWGYDGFYITNLFAFRTFSPKELKQAVDPIGPENHKYLDKYIKLSSLTIAAWGNHGNFIDRHNQVNKLLKSDKLFCLSVTKQGQPKHPLYIKRDTNPQPFSSF